MTLLTELQAELDQMWACRNSFPPPAETLAYALNPTDLMVGRREVLDKLYRENAAYAEVVDDLRKHRKHYEGQLCG